MSIINNVLCYIHYLITVLFAGNPVEVGVTMHVSSVSSISEVNMVGRLNMSLLINQYLVKTYLLKLQLNVFFSIGAHH